jgi:mono/diheme cytochrome c family protein
MRRFLLIVLLVLIVIIVLFGIRLHVAASQTVRPDSGGDATAGQRLAEAWCTECHSIGWKAARSRTDAPNLTDVANRPSTTALSLNTFLRSSHKTMPNFIVERGEADDIVAYVLSLKQK